MAFLSYIDVNECSMDDENICSFANSECVNTPGSYRCKCAKGFLRNKTHCSGMPEAAYMLLVFQIIFTFSKSTILYIVSDIDECKDGFPHNCNITELCINYPGRYKCQCKEGYERFSENETCFKGLLFNFVYFLLFW